MLKGIKKEEEIDKYSEYTFIANCLRMGFTIADLKLLQYKEVAKILFAYTRTHETKYTKATQSDWDRLAK